jgi:hypothetical protein
MIEVYTINIKSAVDSSELLPYLEDQFPELKISLDLEDFHKPYPCGQSILKVEGMHLDIHAIPRLLQAKGIECHILEDKICR